MVSRFETPGIASSPECMAYYMEALQKIGRQADAEAVRKSLAGGAAFQAGNPSLGAEFQNHTSPSALGATGFNPYYGSRKEPLHVVVTESTFTIVSRWVKWLIVFGLVTYGVSEGFRYITENTTLLKTSEVADKSVDVAKTNVKFDDVRGCEEARAELEEIVDFLKDPTKYESLGGKLAS